METLNIRHFKLVNGEELIGLVAVKNDDNFIVEQPVAIGTNLVGGFSFTPWFPFSEHKNYKIELTHIVNHVQVAEDVKQAYVDFVLSLDKRRIPMQQPRSSAQILEELEETLLKKYDEDRFLLDEDEEKTIH
tara:strand:+ start:893 stop:1288 length:396 start_codon:yes stop_codon:yes gene_type:complete